MSILQEILESISEDLTRSAFFKNKEFYLDLSLVTPNTELPCICFQEASSEAEMWKQSINMGCITLSIPIEILVCTDVQTPPEVISQLWDYREEIVKHLATVIPSNIHPNLEDLEYKGAGALEKIEIRALTEYNDNKEVMMNIMAVRYLLSYNL